MLLEAYPEGTSHKTKNGWLPLHIALSAESVSVEVVRTLVTIYPAAVHEAVVELIPVLANGDPVDMGAADYSAWCVMMISMMIIMMVMILTMIMSTMKCEIILTGHDVDVDQARPMVRAQVDSTVKGNGSRFGQSGWNHQSLRDEEPLADVAESAGHSADEWQRCSCTGRRRIDDAAE